MKEKELEQELENKRLYNNCEFHEEDGVYKWYDEDGHLTIKSEMKDDKPHGIQWNYYKNGNIYTKIIYEDGSEEIVSGKRSFCRCGLSNAMPFCDQTHRSKMKWVKLTEKDENGY